MMRSGGKTVLTAALVALGVFAALGTAPRAEAAPEPSIVNPSWQMDIEYEKPQPIAVKNIDGQWKWYWYLPYTVTNNTGQDLLLVPEITIADNTGRIISAGRNVPASVFNAVKAQTGDQLLIRPSDVIGRMLQGEDFAKSSVAIWPASEDDVDELSIFISGLSGETTRVQLPGMEEPVLLSKTLMLRFNTPGSPTTPQNQPVIQRDEQWVMR